MAALVIFDCDGVLINSEEVGVKEEPAFLASYGLIFTPAEYVEFASGMTFEKTIEKLDARHRQIHSGTSLPGDFGLRLKEFYRTQLYPKIRAIDGVHDMLVLLKTNRIPYCVASNSDLTGLHEKLRMTGLHGFFDTHIYSKDMVPNGKPAPDLYLHAARDMGFPPARCIVVEDSVTGLTAGVAASMPVLGFSGGSHRPAHYAQTLMRAGAVETAATMDGIKTILAQRLGIFLGARPRPPGIS